MVPAEAARTRGQLQNTVEQSAAEAEQTRRDYERLHRAADAALEAREVLWARAYLRVWAVLDRLANDFFDEVERVVVAELEAERNRPALGVGGRDEDDDEWGQDGPPVDYLADVTQLRDQEKARRDFAHSIEDRVAELERADARFQPGQQHTLDWTGRAERIEHLIGVIAADGPDDVTDYTAREIWTGAAGVIGGPPVTSYACLAKQLHLAPDSARRAMVELHQAGRVKLYRYFHGRQSEVNPAQLHEQATFHLVLIGDCEGVGHPRPKVIVDL
ncbi:hypothetical protein ACIBI9_65745 [Nonomuraea sp. NPDC050451]|uniref:hypothetical protein n=1 Tax=Nonomuraea sp. NPDC050451 TaxID=3364364 RepID=UPI003789192E